MPVIAQGRVEIMIGTDEVECRLLLGDAEALHPMLTTRLESPEGWASATESVVIVLETMTREIRRMATEDGVPIRGSVVVDTRDPSAKA